MKGYTYLIKGGYPLIVFGDKRDDDRWLVIYENTKEKLEERLIDFYGSMPNGGYIIYEKIPCWYKSIKKEKTNG